MGFMSRRRLTRTAVTLATAVTLVSAGAFVGADVANAGLSSDMGGAVVNVGLATGTDAVTFTSGAWTTVATEEVQDNLAAFLIVTFSAETLCTGSGGWCSMRILVDGIEANPAVGTDFAFDSPGHSWESHSFQRYLLVNGGFHTITAQVSLQAGATSDRLDDWELTTLAANQH